MDRLLHAGRRIDELEGALHALLELHYSVDILAEFQLAPRLQEFPLVVIPNSHKFSDGVPGRGRQLRRRMAAASSSSARRARASSRLSSGSSSSASPKAEAELATPLGPVNLTGSWQTFRPTSGQGRRECAIRRAIFAEAARPRRRSRPWAGAGSAAVYGPVASPSCAGTIPASGTSWATSPAALFDNPAVTTDAPPTVDISLPAGGRRPLDRPFPQSHRVPGPRHVQFHRLCPAGRPLRSRPEGRDQAESGLDPEGRKGAGCAWSWSSRRAAGPGPALKPPNSPRSKFA